MITVHFLRDISLYFRIMVKKKRIRNCPILRGSPYGERSPYSCRLAAFPRDSRDFRCEPDPHVIYSNVGKTARLAEGDILLEITSCLAYPPKLLGKMDV